MKDYLYQFYNDGFATTFYLKPIHYLEKKTKNKKLFKILKNCIKFVYTIVIIALAILIGISKWPL